MTRPTWLDCDHTGIGLSGCPTCDGREDPYDIRRHIREARDYIGEIEAEARRLRSLVDALSEHGLPGFRLSVDYIDPDGEACGWLVTGPTGKEALMMDLLRVAMLDVLREPEVKP